MKLKNLLNESDTLPKVAYHITTEERAKDIEIEGLIPRKSDSYDSYSTKPVVFLITTDKERSTVLSWLHARYRDDESEGDFVLLKIKDLTGLNLVKENGFWATTDKISPNKIENLGWKKITSHKI